MYVLPADVLNVSERTVPYELDVEIVKDCSNFSREIADVFDVIKANCDDYSLVLKKVNVYSISSVLQLAPSHAFLYSLPRTPRSSCSGTVTARMCWPA